MKIRDKIARNFKSNFKGWKVDHTYSAKNGFGALTLHTSQFELNKSFDTVKQVVENN